MNNNIWPDPTKLPPEPVDPSNPAFAIDCVGLHTLRPGMEGTEEETRYIYRMLLCFLQEKGLTTRTILRADDIVSDDVAIRLRDLTAEGDLLMRRPYHKWLEKVDQGMHPSDTTILEKALAKIRAGKAGRYGE